MKRPTIHEAEKLHIEIKGLKLLLTCPTCSRAWSIWFRDENDLLDNLPTNWYVCSYCRDHPEKSQQMIRSYNDGYNKYINK